MKRLVSIILMLVVLCLSTISESVSEEFTYRDGITFGMTENEIRDAETLRIDGQLKGQWIRFGPTKIAGISNSTIEYHFDERNKLNYIYVSLDKEPEYISVGTAYKNVNRELTNKYGKPLGNKKGKTHAYVGDALSNVFEMSKLAKSIPQAHYEYTYDEWVIEQNDGIVKIDHFYTKSSGKGGRGATHVLTYTFFSKNVRNDL